MTREMSDLINGSLLALFIFVVPVAQAQPGTLACGCEFSKVPGAVWWGSESQISVAKLAASAAPILWFSPDEPSLGKAHGDRIATPEPFPFQEATGPVIYYQLREVVRDARTENPAFTAAGSDKGAAMLDLDHTALMSLEYYAYFAAESGLGAHQHDVEPVEYRIAVAHSDGQYLKDLDLPQWAC